VLQVLQVLQVLHMLHKSLSHTTAEEEKRPYISGFASDNRESIRHELCLVAFFVSKLAFFSNI
jgi:hypothetical protein